MSEFIIKLKKWSQNKPLHLLLIVCIAIAFFVRLYHCDAVGFDWDEAVYAGEAYKLLKNNFRLPHFFRQEPYLYEYVTATLFSIIGISDFSAKLVSVLLGTFSILIIFYLASLLYNERVGLISAVLLTISPFHILFSQKATGDMLFSFLVIAAVFFFFKGLKVDKNIWIVISGILLGFAAFTKYIAVLLLPLFTSFFVVSNIGRNHKRNVKKLLLLFIVASIILIPVYKPYLKSINYYYGENISKLLHLKPSHTLPKKLYGFKPIAINPTKYDWQLFRPTKLYYIYVLHDYLTPPIFLLSIMGLLFGLLVRKKGDLYLILWILFFVLFCMVWTNKFARYLFPIVGALIIFTSRFIVEMYEKIMNKRKLKLVGICIIGIIFVWNVKGAIDYYRDFQAEGYRAASEMAKEIFKPGDVILANYAEPLKKWYLRDCKVHWLIGRNRNLVQSTVGRKIVIIDQWNLKRGFGRGFYKEIKKRGDLVWKERYKGKEVMWIYIIPEGA